ncbi:MAG TPA: hypothetical protein PKA00_06220 [Saprospiraceae bacterium]|nr:hypothetical protein [Saprospiraceae bacterium]HMQ82480.1 hypothetical protein [Saprospiraceae bacterium]
MNYKNVFPFLFFIGATFLSFQCTNSSSSSEAGDRAQNNGDKTKLTAYNVQVVRTLDDETEAEALCKDNGNCKNADCYTIIDTSGVDKLYCCVANCSTDLNASGAVLNTTVYLQNGSTVSGTSPAANIRFGAYRMYIVTLNGSIGNENVSKVDLSLNWSWPDNSKDTTALTLSLPCGN